MNFNFLVAVQDDQKDDQKNDSSKIATVNIIPIKKIRSNPNQPRKKPVKCLTLTGLFISNKSKLGLLNLLKITFMPASLT